MLIKGTEVIGLKVITLQKGKEIDKVEDLVYDPSEQKIKALLVDKGGWLSDPLVILMSDVKNIGKDAVIIDSSTLIKKMSEISSDIANIAKNETYITKSKIITEDGTQLGSVSDIFFDSVTGQVERIEVSQGLKDIQSGRKYINVSNIVTIGEDAVIVKSPTKENIEQQASTQGIQGMVNKSKDQAQTIIGGVRSTVEEKKDDLSMQKDLISQKTGDIKDKASEEFSSQKEGIGMQADNMREDFQQKTEDIKEKIKEKVSDVTSDIQEKKKNESVGRYLTVNILSPSDEILAKRGDMITHQLLSKAEQFGLVNQVLNNTSETPQE